MKCVVVIAAVIVLLGVTPVGIAAGQRETPAVDRVWPDPPAPARIRFVRSLSPATGERRGFFSRLWSAVTGGAEQPVMAQPYGLAVGSLGRLYVADSATRSVHVYDLRNGRHSQMALDSVAPLGIAVLGERIVVTDSVAGQVTAMTLNGRTVWTLGKDAGFERPTGIVADVDRLHIVDTLANRIVTVSADGRVMGSFGSRGSEPGQFNFPTNIARDAQGLLYVSDSMNFRVQIFSRDGRYRSGFGRLGDGSGDFNRPKGVAVDPDGHIYVVEGFHDVVQIFDREGQFLLAFGEPGHDAGQFWLASGIHIAGDRIYVADSANGRVQEFAYLGERR